MAKLLLVAVLILMVFSGLALVNPTEAQANYKISGYILDSNGNGLAGAKIIFGVPDIVPSVIASSSGYYEMYAPTGTYHINVWPPFAYKFINN